MSYQTNSKRSPPFWLLIGARTTFSGTNQKPERRRPFGTGLVRHCLQGLFSPFFTFLRAIYFSARLNFSSSPLSAPGSPRMMIDWSLFHSSSKKILSGKSSCGRVKMEMIENQLENVLISRRTRIIPRFATTREMTSEERAQKFHSDDVSLHYPDLGSTYGLGNPKV